MDAKYQRKIEDRIHQIGLARAIAMLLLTMTRRGDVSKATVAAARRCHDELLPFFENCFNEMSWSGRRYSSPRLDERWHRRENSVFALAIRP